MKLSKGYEETAFEIREKTSGKIYDCFIQDYEYTNGKHQTRFNIGINGWLEWSFLYYLDETEFNSRFEVVE